MGASVRRRVRPRLPESPFSDSGRAACSLPKRASRHPNPSRRGGYSPKCGGRVNTGLAIANPNDAPATILFHFRDAEGERFGEGSYVLDAHQQIAKFLDQEPFNSDELESGTFTFTSSVPIAVIALRGLTNQDGEFLMTTLPVAPLASTLTDTVYFPHFTDGDGWVTQVILVNPTDRPITGTVRFLEPGSGATAAAPAVLTLDDDRTGSEFPYSIPAGSSQRFTTSNPTGIETRGSVRATPNPGSVAPSGLVVFSYTPGGVKTVSESGVPALPAGQAFRVYAESAGTPNQPGSIRTGLAITNAADTTNMVTLEVTSLDGKLAMGVAPVTLPLPASGQVARFMDEIFDSLPGNFSGVLRVTSTADVAIVGLRLRINERGELKMTTTPPSIETGLPTTADRFFPHIVDSAGWSTQFILFSGTAGQTSSGTLSFSDASGQPLDLVMAPAPGKASHNIMLRVVRVTPDWHAYDIAGGGWPSAVPVKESEFLKYFEVAIWEETEAIHLYEFDNDFDPLLGLSPGITPEQMTAHRESYAIRQVVGLPEAGSDARSPFIREAFADFTSYLASRYPDSPHHLMYNGHGGPGGRLFAAQLSYRDANGLLADWTANLGRPLGVVDMGGPCNKGSFSDLENFCQYAKYYIASDLPNGGYTFDDWTGEKYDETNEELQYHRLFAETSNITDALFGRIDLKRKAYEYSRVNMTESRTAQANYLYSCEGFVGFSRDFRAFLNETRGTYYSIRDDLYDYMIRNGASDELVEAFGDVIVHRADNKDFFQWEEIHNGMLMPNSPR